jgi:hypothetical protein
MPRVHLKLDALERRDVPATFGIPWPSGTALTVSFVPDGADVDGSANELYALMEESGLPPAVWQNEILRAFQAWTSQADLNIGLVPDDGSSLGVPGYEQADARFGDIRIFAVPLASSVLAITTPPGDVAGTRTGDIILNSNYNFGVGTGSPRDLYTVFLQEAGHAFGVGNSPNQASAMYEFYQGPRTGLSAEDVTSIQHLYGARPTQTWEPETGNDSSSAATPLTGIDDRVTYGDVTSVSDQDWYSFTVPTAGSATITLDVEHLSLVAGHIAVFNSDLIEIGFAAASGAGQDLAVAMEGLEAGATYYVRVDGVAGTGFAAGQYRLRIDTGGDGPSTLTLGGQAPVDDSGTNENFLSATRLSNVATDGGTHYQVFAHLGADDTDVYKVRSPFPGFNQTNVLTATVRAFGDVAPEITVTNALGLVVSARVIADGNGLYTVLVDGAAANADYHIGVQSRTGTAGDYELQTSFRSRVATAHQIESGLLTLFNPKKTGTLQITGSAQIYFRLSALLTPIVGPSIMLKVYDSSNHVKFQLLARAGDTVDGIALLGPGSYRIEIKMNGFSFLPGVASGFSLKTALLTDPVGVPPSDPNNPGGESDQNPPSDPPSGYNYYNDRGYYVWGEQTPSGGG